MGSTEAAPEMQTGTGESSNGLSPSVSFVFDVEEQLQVDVWAELVCRAAGYACNRCGAKKEQLNSTLHAHHINYVGDDNRLSNGECLCRSCHSREHSYPPHTGRKRTPETRKRMSEAQKRRYTNMTPERRADIARAQKLGRWPGIEVSTDGQALSQEAT